MSDSDKDILELERAVVQLHEIGTTMGTYLENQQHSLDRINAKAEDVNDITLAATLKSSRIMQRYDRTEGTFLGQYQFVDIQSGKFLSVENQYLVLTETPRRSSFYHCFLRQDTLIGIQNCKTFKFLGTTVIGNIKVSGEYWGKSEDCFVDLTSGQPTGILILSRNWGGGGWLKAAPSSAGYLSDSTTSITDKKDILELNAIKTSNKLDNSHASEGDSNDD
jgi:hypothetical protein